MKYPGSAVFPFKEDKEDAPFRKTAKAVK